jgi:hypothetical protein
MTTSSGRWVALLAFVVMSVVTSSDYYWSSTTYRDGTGLASFVDFSNGYVGAEGKMSSVRVRAVRGGS